MRLTLALAWLALLGLTATLSTHLWHFPLIGLLAHIQPCALEPGPTPPAPAPAVSTLGPLLAPLHHWFTLAWLRHCARQPHASLADAWPACWAQLTRACAAERQRTCPGQTRSI